MPESRPANSYPGRPSLCRSCGALVGAGEAACSACGAPPGGTSAESAAEPPRRAIFDPETARFARAVLTRPATFTFVLLALNVFVFLLMYFSGGTEDVGVLRAYGAKFNSLINAGEWWRLVTPVFIHIGPLHLIVNMYSLFMLGPYVERLYGSARFVFFWIATGVAGVAASYFASGMGYRPGPLGQFLFRGGDGPSAGASGALFGLVGVLFVFGIKFRKELPSGFKRAFGFGMLPTILINLGIGYTIPFIDNAAHLGGLLAGMLLALFVGYKRPGEHGTVAFAWHALQIAALAVVAAAFGEVAAHFDGPRPQLARERAPAGLLPPGPSAALTDYVAAINQGQEAFSAAVSKGDATATERALRQIDRAKGPDEQTAQLLKELRALVERARAYALLGEKERAAPRAQAQLKQLLTDFRSWEARHDNWVKTEGPRFGLVLREEPRPTADGGEQPERGQK